MTGPQQLSADLSDDHPQKLIYHLGKALIDPEDINLDAYCDLWLNLCKFIQAWGYLLRFVTDDVTVKVNAILAIRAENAQESETFKKLTEWENRENKMRKYKPKSGTANVLVLHRAMLFVMDLIDEVYQEKEDDARVHVIASRVYGRTLSRYHKFLIRSIVPTAFRILPSRGEFVSIMRGPMDPQKDEEFHSEFMKLSRVLHQRVAVILEQYEMTEFTKYNE